MEPPNRFHQIRRVLFYTLMLNWGVAAAKLAYGWMIHSVSMKADGFHSFSDGASNLVGLLGIWIASRPVDQNHPYGHKKYETLASVGISVFLFLICFNILREGIDRFVHPVIPEVSFHAFAVMLMTLAINTGVMIYENKKGKELNSDLLLSDALHTGADLLTSTSVIITLIAIRMGYPLVDPIASILIAFFIGYAAIQIMRESTRVLSDGTAIPTRDIERVVLTIKGVKECHKIRSRGRVDDIHIDLHIQVDRNMDVHKAHHLSDAIESKIKRDFKGVTDVVVHLEPFETEKAKSPV